MGTKKVEYICTKCMNTGFSLKNGTKCKCNGRGRKTKPNKRSNV